MIPFLKAIMHLPNHVYNCLCLRYKKVKHGANFHINGRIYCHGSGRIIIGDNVTVNSSPIVNPVAGGTHTHLLVNKGAEIVIGNCVGMSHVNISAFTRVVIEDNVFLGSCVRVWDTDFHSQEYADRVNGDVNAKSTPVHIKEGAFVGACSIILKGVTIGRHSIIGAGSVVTKSVPDNEVWAGNPAKLIRMV